MPKLVLPVPETIESVTRPIVLDITRQLAKYTGLPDARIYFPGDMEKDRQPGTSISDNGLTNTFGSNPKVTLDVEEEYEADRMLTSAVYRPENLFIFRDDRIETSIKPVYSSTEITINFRGRFMDKVAATRWRDDIRARVSMDRQEFLHDITYHYLIPKEFLVILKELHRMRENVAGYGEDYDTYFKANTTQRASELTNLNGSVKEWGIAEKQMRILGWFEFEGVPEKGSKEDEDDTWVISFSYKFRFDKPIACVMQYPLVVHNQIVGKAFRPTEKPYQVEHHQRSYALSAKSFSMFEKTREVMAVASQPGVSIPDYDEFIPSAIVTDTLRVFTILLTLDLDKPTELFNLTQLGKNWSLDPDVIEFMKGEAPYMTKRYQSLFQLNLYQGPTLIQDGVLQCDADLNVTSSVPLPPREYYHVRLSIVTDLELLPGRALDRAREHGGALIKAIDAIDPTVKEVCTMPSLIGDKYVPRNYVACASDQINRSTLAKGDGQIRQFNTVMSLFIEANRRTD